MKTNHFIEYDESLCAISKNEACKTCGRTIKYKQ